MKINIKATHTQDVTVSVTKDELYHKVLQSFSEKDIYLLTRDKLYRKMNLPQNAFIKNEKWYYKEEMYSSHSFTRSVFLRDVTESDKVMLELLEDLKRTLDND